MFILSTGKQNFTSTSRFEGPEKISIQSGKNKYSIINSKKGVKMKLIIRRGQETKIGRLGEYKGMRFILSYRVELTPEEQALATKYKVENLAIAITKYPNGDVISIHSIESLIQGGREIVDDVNTALDNEDVLKNACRGFKTLLEVMASFGAEEVYEF